MTFTETVAPDQAEGAVAEMYAADRATFGLLPNFTRAFSLRPEVYAAWRRLMGAVKGNMDERRYELVTLAAARRLRSSYCSLAHGKILADRFHDADTVRAMVGDHGAAGLDAVDVAVMDLADKVAADATSVTEADIDRLRRLGLADAEIFDVVLAASLRCFYSKTLDAVGVEPDSSYADLEPSLRDALTVGRPIAAR